MRHLSCFSLRFPGKACANSPAPLGIWPAPAWPRERQKDLLSSSFQKEFQLSGAWQGVTSLLHHFWALAFHLKAYLLRFQKCLLWHQAWSSSDHKIIRRTWKCLEWNRWHALGLRRKGRVRWARCESNSYALHFWMSAALKYVAGSKCRSAKPGIEITLYFLHDSFKETIYYILSFKIMCPFSAIIVLT